MLLRLSIDKVLDLAVGIKVVTRTTNLGRLPEKVVNLENSTKHVNTLCIKNRCLTQLQLTTTFDTEMLDF